MLGLLYWGAVGAWPHTTASRRIDIAAFGSRAALAHKEGRNDLSVTETWKFAT